VFKPRSPSHRTPIRGDNQEHEHADASPGCRGRRRVRGVTFRAGSRRRGGCAQACAAAGGDGVRVGGPIVGLPGVSRRLYGVHRAHLRLGGRDSRQRIAHRGAYFPPRTVIMSKGRSPIGAPRPPSADPDGRDGQYVAIRWRKQSPNRALCSRPESVACSRPSDCS